MGFWGLFGCSRIGNSSLFAPILEPEANQPKPVSSSLSALPHRRNHAQPPTRRSRRWWCVARSVWGFETLTFPTIAPWCHGSSHAVRATAEPRSPVPPPAGSSSPPLFLCAWWSGVTGLGVAAELHPFPVVFSFPRDEEKALCPIYSFFYFCLKLINN